MNPGAGRHGGGKTFLMAGEDFSDHLACSTRKGYAGGKKKPLRNDMESYATTTKTVEDLAQDSAGLLQKLKGWNLISGLYEYPENKDEDLVHAYAQQARDIVVQMVRLMCERVTAALKGKAGRHENLTRKLQDLGERERNLCSLCHQALLNLKGKEAAR